MIDHLVYGAGDLGRAVEELTARLGVAPSPGGKHEGRGTHNALLSLGERSYLEIIAPDPEEPAPSHPLPYRLHSLGRDTLIAWVAAVPDIENRAGRAIEMGFDPGPVTTMSRRRTDGTLLEWRVALRREIAGDGLVPLLIDWGDTPHPGTTSPQGCHLLDLRGEHPDTDAIRRMLDAMQVQLRVDRAAEPGLIRPHRDPTGRGGTAVAPGASH